MAQGQESQRRKLNELRQALKQGGFDTSKFKESQAKLKEKINQSTAAIEKQKHCDEKATTTTSKKSGLSQQCG